MKAAYSSAPRSIDLRDVARPTPGAGDVIVRIRNCGVCGSDLHWYSGGWPPPSVCPGHEISGEVAEVGAGVTGVKAGDRVAIEPLVVCGDCHACRTGNRQLCRRLRILGTMIDGGFAEYVRTPASTLFALPARLDWATAAMTEPLAVCVHAVRLAKVRLGDRVAVLGAGTIGLLSVVAARAAGAAEVLITARHPHQRTRAEALGARAFAATDDGTVELSEYAGAHPIDAVIETVGGAADTLNDAVHLVRPGGAIAVLGVFTAPVSLNALLVMMKEVRIVGSLTYSRAGHRADFDAALDLLATQTQSVRQLITHRFPLNRIAEAFAAAADKRSGAIKVTIDVPPGS
ncbi:MAG TPA: alcohol dehydrogenase catalytic domain-containing protein [Candidatus Binatia bacterium]|nr:alcohol dehydrogenase catalytic domain-containing protein [Candidatus Binatia bacterium]